MSSGTELALQRVRSLNDTHRKLPYDPCSYFPGNKFDLDHGVDIGRSKECQEEALVTGDSWVCHVSRPCGGGEDEWEIDWNIVSRISKMGKPFPIIALTPLRGNLAMSLFQAKTLLQLHPWVEESEIIFSRPKGVAWMRKHSTHDPTLLLALWEKEYTRQELQELGESFPSLKIDGVPLSIYSKDPPSVEKEFMKYPISSAYLLDVEDPWIKTFLAHPRSSTEVEFLFVKGNDLLREIVRSQKVFPVLKSATLELEACEDLMELLMSFVLLLPVLLNIPGEFQLHVVGVDLFYIVDALQRVHHPKLRMLKGHLSEYNVEHLMEVQQYLSSRVFSDQLTMKMEPVDISCPENARALLEKIAWSFRIPTIGEDPDPDHQETWNFKNHAFPAAKPNQCFSFGESKRVSSVEENKLPEGLSSDLRGFLMSTSSNMMVSFPRAILLKEEADRLCPSIPLKITGSVLRITVTLEKQSEEVQDPVVSLEKRKEEEAVDREGLYEYFLRLLNVDYSEDPVEDCYRILVAYYRRFPFSFDIDGQFTTKNHWKILNELLEYKIGQKEAGDLFIKINELEEESFAPLKDLMMVSLLAPQELKF